MENKINIAEILKDCPKGTKLYSPIFGEVYLDKIRPHLAIVVETVKGQSESNEEFLYDGRYSMNGECMLFPSKGETTWEGFVPPCKFKDGDIIFTHANCLKVGLGNTWISIFHEKRNGGVATYVDYAEDGSDYYSNIDGDKALLCMENDILRQRLATEEEKQKLFDAIKNNGYRWDTETKTLEKLRECKFDITTLKHFEKVLIRVSDRGKWCGDFYMWYDCKEKDFPYNCACGMWAQCIPYEGNEHLCGTTNDCDEFYKTWER
jgi:hypothetical protein